MTPKELINLSLQHEVEIEAHTTIPPIQLISYDFPGCRPLSISSVPLYMALHLRNSNYCTIRPLAYLAKNMLESIIERENASKAFIELPDFFFEHAYIFMDSTIEASISELKQIRRDKVWKGLKDMDGRALYINGLTRWEFSEMRSVIIEAMKLGRKVDSEKELIM
ncbi:GINS complex subunit 2 [Pancytospora epiphaga]|nr:GINS complex subunit 2 [Pancytospora epiphaga]